MPVSLAKPFARVRDALAWRASQACWGISVWTALHRSARQMLAPRASAACLHRRHRQRRQDHDQAAAAGDASPAGARGSASAYNRPTDIAQDHPALAPRPRFLRRRAERGATRVRWIRNVALLQPGIGIVTVVRDDHGSDYSSRDAIAAEISKLVAVAPATGTAVLNADDERVLAMGDQLCRQGHQLRNFTPRRTARRRHQLGVARSAADDARARRRARASAHPALRSALGSFGARSRGRRPGRRPVARRVRRRHRPRRALRRPHAAGDDARRRDLHPRRLQGAAVDGRCVLRLHEGRACQTEDHRHRRDFGHRAQERETSTRRSQPLPRKLRTSSVFVGPWASSVLKARKPGRDGALRAFSRVRDAAEYINSITREGDLVLLKGTNTQDHLLSHHPCPHR